MARAIQSWINIEIFASIEMAQNHLLNLHYAKRRISHQSLLHHHRHVVWHKKNWNKVEKQFMALARSVKIASVMEKTKRFNPNAPSKGKEKSFLSSYKLMWMLVHNLYSCMLKEQITWHPVSKSMLLNSLGSWQHVFLFSNACNCYLVLALLCAHPTD